jgi:hypothetical protein
MGISLFSDLKMMNRESLRPPQITVISPMIDSKGGDLHLHEDDSIGPNKQNWEDSGQSTCRPPDEQGDAHSNLRSHYLLSRRTISSIKKVVETYHEDMFGFFGLSLQPTVYADSATEGSDLPDAQHKADEMAKIKERARQRLQTEMVTITHTYTKTC